MRGQGCRPCRLGGFGPGRCTACRRPHLRHPLRFISRHLGGRGLGEGSKDLIGLALAISDLPGLHQGEAGRGGGSDALGGQGVLDGGIDLARRPRPHGKGLVIVQSQVIAEPHQAGHGGYPTRRKRRFGETAGEEVVFSSKFERPHHGRVKVHRRPLVIHLDRRFSILGGGPRRRHFAIIRGILLCRAPCALARGFCCFGQPKRGRPRRNNKRDVLEGGERQWQTQRTLQTWHS